MSKRQWLIVCGVLIIILPFLGLPSGLDRAVLVVIGLLVIVIAYRLSLRRDKPALSSSSGPLPFVEHKNGGSDITDSFPPKE